MARNSVLLLGLAAFNIPSLAAEPAGSIAGMVYDAATRSPLTSAPDAALLPPTR
jgi:hypothetical protein